jgi:hypothetical protein
MSGLLLAGAQLTWSILGSCVVGLRGAGPSWPGFVVSRLVGLGDAKPRWLDLAVSRWLVCEGGWGR